MVLAQYCDDQWPVVYPAAYLGVLHVFFSLGFYFFFEKGTNKVICLLLLVLPVTAVAVFVFLKRLKNVEEEKDVEEEPDVEEKKDVEEESMQFTLKRLKNVEREKDALEEEPDAEEEPDVEQELVHKRNKVKQFSLKRLKNVEKETVYMRNTVIHFTFQMTVHHLLWILLGVLTEPLWAIPVLVITCAVWYCIHLLAHYFVKANIKEKEKWYAVLLSVLLVLSVMLGLLVLGVVAQSFVGTDPLTGIVSSALAVVATWWLQRVV